MLVDRLHGEKALVADRTDEQLLSERVRGTRRGGVFRVALVVVAVVGVVMRTVALLFVATVTVAMELLSGNTVRLNRRGLIRRLDRQVQRSVERGIDDDRRRRRRRRKELMQIGTSSEVQPGVGIEGKGGMVRSGVDHGWLRKHLRRALGDFRWNGRWRGRGFRRANGDGCVERRWPFVVVFFFPMFIQTLSPFIQVSTERAREFHWSKEAQRSRGKKSEQRSPTSIGIVRISHSTVTGRINGDVVRTFTIGCRRGSLIRRMRMRRSNREIKFLVCARWGILDERKREEERCTAIGQKSLSKRERENGISLFSLSLSLVLSVLIFMSAQ